MSNGINKTQRELEKESEDEMKKFQDQLDLEKKLGKHLIFIQSGIKLDSAFSFSQYIFKNIRLITMIGEKHEKSWPCPKPSISISEYCRQSVVRNPKCKIMLEYNKGDDASRIASKAIRDTYYELNKVGKLNVIIPFDTRAFFLGVEGQTDLYGLGYNKHATSWEKIGEDFIEPFFLKSRADPKLFTVEEENYDSYIRQYLNNYVKKIEKTFYKIASYFNKISGEKIHQMLKDVWKDVADFFILKYLLRNDDNTDEYIIILGLAHYDNLTKILKDTTRNLVHRIGNSKDCVKLFQTYRFDD